MNNKNTNRTPPCDSSKKVYHLINYQENNQEYLLPGTRFTSMIQGDLSLFTFKMILKVNYFVSQAITETSRAMSKKYTRISKSHIVKRIVETKLHSAIFLENYDTVINNA